TPAVDDHQAAARSRAGDVGGDGRQRGVRQHVAPQLDDGVYGHGPGSSSDAVSSSPSIRFMFWIAWPAPPLIRLSVALTIARVRVPPCASPSVKPTSAKLLPETAATSGSRSRTNRTNGSPS